MCCKTFQKQQHTTTHTQKTGMKIRNTKGEEEKLQNLLTCSLRNSNVAKLTQLWVVTE